MERGWHSNGFGGNGPRMPPWAPALGHGCGNGVTFFFFINWDGAPLGVVALHLLNLHTLPRAGRSRIGPAGCQMNSPAL